MSSPDDTFPSTFIRQIKKLQQMKKSDLILQVQGPESVTLKIYIEPDNSVRLHKSQVVSPWPDHYSMKDILAKEYQEQRDGLDAFFLDKLFYYSA